MSISIKCDVVKCSRYIKNALRRIAHNLTINFSFHLVEHGDEGASHSADPNPFPNSRMSNDIERIEDLEDSDSDNGEFITIKVTNTEGQIEPQEADHIKEHQQHQKMR
jgi:hypothetical protein